jgi:hypothetical protein
MSLETVPEYLHLKDDERGDGLGISLTKFHVLDEENNIVGSINVPNEQVNDLLRHWQGPVQTPLPQMKVGKPRPMSRAAILRGCL